MNIAGGNRSWGKRRPRQKLGWNPGWRAKSAVSRRRFRFRPQQYYGFITLGLLAAMGAWHNLSPALASFLPNPVVLSFGRETVSRHFPICGSSARSNCVIDGDTFWFEGEKIRIADINTPEISDPRCSAEAQLGNRAKLRLQSLLNSGPFEMRRGLRDADIYGRKLRTLHRSGRSLGGTLVSEDLAHKWNGYKESWCS